MSDEKLVSEEEPQLEMGRSKALLWVALGLVLVVGLGFAAVQTIGGSVMYYRTPTEVVADGPGVSVRLAGQLVKGSVSENAKGETTFQITDEKGTVVDVVYTGGATTALTTAAKPGTQMVAEGQLGEDGIFVSENLMAKCPSKFQKASTPAADNA